MRLFSNVEALPKTTDALSDWIHRVRRVQIVLPWCHTFQNTLSFCKVVWQHCIRTRLKSTNTCSEVFLKIYRIDVRVSRCVIWKPMGLDYLHCILFCRDPISMDGGIIRYLLPLTSLKMAELEVGLKTPWNWPWYCCDILDVHLCGYYLANVLIEGRQRSGHIDRIILISFSKRNLPVCVILDHQPMKHTRNIMQFSQEYLARNCEWDMKSYH